MQKFTQVEECTRCRRCNRRIINATKAEIKRKTHAKCDVVLAEILNLDQPISAVDMTYLYDYRYAEQERGDDDAIIGTLRGVSFTMLMPYADDGMSFDEARDLAEAAAQHGLRVSQAKPNRTRFKTIIKAVVKFIAKALDRTLALAATAAASTAALAAELFAATAWEQALGEKTPGRNGRKTAAERKAIAAIKAQFDAEDAARAATHNNQETISDIAA